VRAYLDLPRSLRPPVVLEARAPWEARANRRRPPVAPPGEGRAVLLLPGFYSTDTSLGRLARWLADAGWRVGGLGSANRACADVVAERAADRLARLVGHDGRPAAVVGHSRGGQVAKVLAVRHPELVSQVVTLASPLTDPFAVHVSVRLMAGTSALLSRLGVPDLVQDCPFGECCRAFHDDLLAPATVPLTTVFSRSDGIVYWRACTDPCGTPVEVRASHLGIVDNAGAWRAVGEALRADA
jgi:pimeloyl-ACP methyl ester carboxylesterase